MLLNKDGINAVLIRPDKPLPVFSGNVIKPIALYTVEKFEKGNIKREFDFLINGSSAVVNLPRINAIDYLYPEAVLKKVKYKVCMLHDFAPLYYRHFIPTKRDEINYLLECEALKYMDHIFTNSKFVAESGAKLLNRPINDFTYLYGGADTDRFRTKSTGKEYSRDGRNHDLVNVSDVCPRKNYKGVTEAFCRAYLSGEIPQDARLVFICNAPDVFKKTIKAIAAKFKLKYGKQVVATGYISDTQMADIISHATCSIFPSLYEGLGLPILESYAAGTPCITANSSSTKELAIDEALFNPNGIEEIQKKIVQVYTDEDMLKKNLEFGQQLICEFNWDNSAGKLFDKLCGLQKRKDL